MQCHICSKILKPDEIKFDPDFQDFSPCGVCLEVINNVFSDPLDEDEVTYLLNEEWGDFLQEDEGEEDVSNSIES